MGVGVRGAVLWLATALRTGEGGVAQPSLQRGLGDEAVTVGARRSTPVGGLMRKFSFLLPCFSRRRIFPRVRV